MTISSAVRTAGPYTGNGVTTIYPFAFKVFATTEVVALRSDGTTETTLVAGSDYTVTLNADQNATPGGTVTTLGTPLSALYTLTLTSNVTELQGTSLTNQGGFFPKVIENALDRAIILIQQLRSIANRSLRFPLSDTGVNTELPVKNSRANNLLGFDASGNPIAVAPTAGSATALQTLLATTNGSTYVGNGGETVAATFAALQLADYVALRAYAGPRASVYCTGYLVTLAPSGVAGFFVRDDHDTTSTDNGGTIIVASNGKRWKRAYDGNLNVQWFGATGLYTNDDLAAIQSAISAAAASPIGGAVFFPTPAVAYKVTGPIYQPSYVALLGADTIRCIIRKSTSTLGTGTVAMRAGAVTDSYVVDAIVIVTHAANVYANNVRIEGLTLDRAAYANGSYGVYVPRSHRLGLKDLLIKNCDIGYSTFDSWMGSLENVTVQAARTPFQHVNDGAGVGAGTSMTFKNCWSNFDNTICEPVTAFSFYGLTYSSMISCGCDNARRVDGAATYAYTFNTCQGITMLSCGTENGSGGALSLNASVVNVMTFRTVGMLGVAAGTFGTVNADSSSVLTLTNCTFGATTSPGVLYDWVIQNGATVIEYNPKASPSGGNSFISYSGGASKTRHTGTGITRADSTGSYGLTDTVSGSVSALAGTPITIYNLPVAGSYWVYVWVGSSGSAYRTVALVTTDGVAAESTNLKAGGNLTITISTLAVQVTSVAGAGVNFRIVRQT